MAYVPPSGDEVNLALILYIPPSGDSVDFELIDGLSSDINSEIYGIGTVTSEINSEIYGVAEFSEINSEIMGSVLEDDSINSVIIGKAFLRIKRHYRIIVKDENDEVIGEFTKFRKLNFGKRLNNYGTASFEVPMIDPKLEELYAPRKYTVWIYYQKDATTTLVWSGEQARRRGKLDSKKNNWCTIYCYDWFEQLSARYTEAERIFTAVDAGEIAETLIEETQDQTNGDFGITIGTIQTTVPRDRQYFNQNIMEAIIALSNVLSGFDFEITNNRVFNVYDVKGVDRSEDIVLEYGRNVKNVDIDEDFSNPVNRGIIIGQSTDDDTALVRVESDDAGLQAEYKVREGLSSEMDVSENETMEDKGAAMIRKYGLPLMKVDIDLTSVQTINITQFDTGDSATLIIKDGVYNISEQYRIFEWSVTFDEKDVEILSLILGNFTYE